MIQMVGSQYAYNVWFLLGICSVAMNSSYWYSIGVFNDRMFIVLFYLFYKHSDFNIKLNNKQTKRTKNDC